MRRITDQKQLDWANRVAKRKSDEGKKVDNIQYEGERGRFEMKFNGEEFVSIIDPNDESCFDCIDWNALAEIVIKNKHK